VKREFRKGSFSVADFSRSYPASTLLNESTQELFPALFLQPQGLEIKPNFTKPKQKLLCG
jgi:hypothetical protein